MQQNCQGAGGGAAGSKAGEKSNGKGKDRKPETASKAKDNEEDDKPEGVWLMDDTSNLWDDFTQFTHLYLLCTKDEAFSAYKFFEAWANTQFDAKIKQFHSD
ncbi:hypothetical protein BDR04DRAFT_1147047 [Suillus decipiens]|nr:hypothetical protein BDR04DRAFT_1147047 [Suillus decipiens]